MTDERPRPRYGEYATPENQVLAGGTAIPAAIPEQAVALQPSTAQTSTAQASVVEPSAAQTSNGKSPRGKPARGTSATGLTARAGDAPVRRRWDLYLTSMLLAYGLFTVVSGLFQYSDLRAVIQNVYTSQGIGTFTSSALAHSAGLIVNLVNLVLYAVTLLLAVRRLRASRIAFWIPLTAGVVAGIITAVVFMVVIFADPAFISYMSSRR